MNNKTVYSNGYIFDSIECRFKPGSVTVQNGIISDVVYSDSPFKGDGLFDLNGNYLIPGLIDMHTHGRAGHDFIGSDESEIKDMLFSYAEAGTTSVMATLASAEMNEYDSSFTAINNIRRSQKNQIFGASVLGIHLEGRYINEKKRGAHALKLLAPLNPDELASMISKMYPLPVHISAAPELEGGEDFIRMAKKMGATFSIAHTDATDLQARNAVEWGASSFTHTYNAMRPIHHREPGVICAALMRDDAFAEIICDGEHVHPHMIELFSRCKPKDKVILITDSMEAAGCSDGQYSIAGTKVFVKNGKALNEEGVLAGSTLDLFSAVKNYSRFTNLPFETALICATRNPAELLGISDKTGSIKKGCSADFLIIGSTADPQIKKIIIRNSQI